MISEEDALLRLSLPWDQLPVSHMDATLREGVVVLVEPTWDTDDPEAVDLPTDRVFVGNIHAVDEEHAIAQAFDILEDTWGCRVLSAKRTLHIRGIRP